MLTRARSLLSRVFSFDTPSTQIRLDDVYDDNNDETSDENDTDNNVDDDIDHSTTPVDNDDQDDLTDSDEDECPTGSSSKGKYERQINDYPTKNKSNMNLPRSHEKSKQDRLISAMQIATSRCNVESMKRLLTNFEMDINHRDQYGMSYLEHAILMGSFDMVDLLIRFGCDLYQG